MVWSSYKENLIKVKVTGAKKRICASVGGRSAFDRKEISLVFLSVLQTVGQD